MTWPEALAQAVVAVSVAAVLIALFCSTPRSR